MALLNVEQAAQFLQVSKSWLYQHPEVPRHRIPGSTLLRFDQDELMAWVKSKTKSPETIEEHSVYHRNPRYRG
jgi:predicted DNA-binding transcriptional regulator AlpA